MLHIPEVDHRWLGRRMNAGIFEVDVVIAALKLLLQPTKQVGGLQRVLVGRGA
jgi:hypothetical protein